MPKIDKINSYWIDRAKERNESNIRASDDVVRLISEQYDRALKQIEREIATLFYKYAEDNELTYAKATELLTGNELREFRMSLAKYMAMIDAPEILLELETLTTRSRISNLEAAFFEIQKQLDSIYLFQFEHVENLMAESTKDNYYKELFGVALFAGFTPRDFHKLTKDEILKEFAHPWSGKNFSERLWKNRSKLKDTLEEEIIHGAVRGFNPQKIVKRIKEKFGVSKKAASRLVHTEQEYFTVLGQKKAYNELNLDQYIYIATLDIKTSETCRVLDHQIFYVKDMQSGVNAPPMHPDCRSATAPYLGELKGTRIARDKNGNNVKVPKNMTYKEWHEKYVESDKEYMLEEKKWKNRHSDKKQYENYKKAGVEVPKSFEKYQDMKYNKEKEYKRAKDQYRSFNKIDKKSWDQKFKDKCKNTIARFAKEHDIDLNDHSVASYYDRIADKSKPSHMSESDFVDLVKSKPNFREVNGDSVIYKNGIAVIKSADNPNNIISIVSRNKPKKGWVDYD